MQTKRGGYRGKPKPTLPPHLKRVRVNVRIQQWMIDQLKSKGEINTFATKQPFFSHESVLRQESFQIAAQY